MQSPSGNIGGGPSGMMIGGSNDSTAKRTLDDT